MGFFDADGCITWGIRKDRNKIWQKISFTSQLHLLEGIQKMLYNNIGISSTIKPKSNEDCYIIQFSNKEDVLKFINYIIYLTLYQQRLQLLFYSYSNIIIYSKNFNNY